MIIAVLAINFTRNRYFIALLRSYIQNMLTIETLEDLMKVIEYNRIGNPADVLEIKEVPSRAPAAGEVRVQVLATPIHPSNLLQIAGLYGTMATFPSTPGAEGVGAVVEIGEGVSHLQAGQKVLLAGVGGTWREEITAPAQAFIPVPDGDLDQLSMAVINPMTAHLLLTAITDLKEGDWIIQSAANSAVGEYLIQLAAQRGINTINAVRRESLAPELKSLGATVVLVDGPNLVDEAQAATGGADIVYGIDSVGGETFSRMLQTLCFGGTLASYGLLSMQQPSLDLSKVIFNDIRVKGFWLAKWFETASPEDKQTAFGTIIPLIAGGSIKSTIDARFKLEDIAKAVTRAGESGRGGKVLLTP